ncbi:MAG TPA: dTDP-4-dehydrorhamnose reductase [Candidatus Margulisbacteria bacterium]|nr:MAG: dTDP-4-dehydrorhamnose reductase [Candidatus Margulisbacteria bacterium GWD2_39_127]OGI03584.1 MAG: dTDP-4-dehydrorhamnose reductase [Candidatus Margulisbacteria bacterium GWF2_38_17]OGI11088.1 MAG: dTDP-4-dehydrorhamnose reductase [Candidatus Margulisbacteria bacterium GWE2_39_32]HAR62313.1 dTDP-4-dehydrorhamnose reductase [Candidatus Margulisiibacteriota bacterium]
MVKIVIIGSNGMLGSRFLSDHSKDDYITGIDYPDMDIRNMESIKSLLLEIKPHIVINCAAFTDVDKCEIMKDESYAVNGEGPGNIAKVCNEIDAVLVHFSTDYVFDGLKKTAYCEDDIPNPLSIYGKSKLVGEMNVRRFCSKYFIIRTAWLYGENGKNFVRTIVAAADKNPSLKVVADQLGSPTYTKDLVEISKKLIKTEKYGTYHVTNEGSCSWYEFAGAIFSFLDKQVSVAPCSTDEYPRPASRPKSGILSKSKINSLDIYIRDWKDGLKEYLLNREINL